MNDNGRFEERRRALLVALLGAGVFAGCAPVLGRRPAPLGANRSVWRAEGGFTVNGQPGNEATRIRPGDTVETDGNGGVVFAVGTAAFLARASSRVQLRASAANAADPVAGVAVERGGLLSVYGGGVHRVDLPLAIIDIRGTGLYVQVEGDADYVCTCYGHAVIRSRTDAASTDEVRAVHHDTARLVTREGASGTRVQPAPFKDHNDQELLLIEALVGREPPYPVPGDAYGFGRGPTY